MIISFQRGWFFLSFLNGSKMYIIWNWPFKTMQFCGIRCVKMLNNHHHYLLPECFLLLKTLPRHPHPAYPSPWQPLRSFWFLWICLVCILHINGIVSYVRLCAWLLSLGIIFFPAVPHSVWDFSDWAQHKALGTGLPGKSLLWRHVFQVCTCCNMNQFLIFKWPNNIPLRNIF